MIARTALFVGVFSLLAHATTGAMANPRPEPNPTPERPGCCSHHQGVCGCVNNRAKCCDGSLSPSCGCD
jgi:hypothetical protein